MSLDKSFNQFRDDSFTRFLRQLLNNNKKASFMSGEASEFEGRVEELKSVDNLLRQRGGLANSLSMWSSFIPPIEATRFLLELPEEDLEDGLFLLEAVVDQSRPVNAIELRKAMSQKIPNSMRAIMLGVGGESRVEEKNAPQRRIVKPSNPSGLNLDAMRNFK